MYKLLRRGLGLVSVMLLAACGGGGGGGGGGSSGGGSAPAFACTGASSSTGTADFNLSTVQVALTAAAGATASGSQQVSMTLRNPAIAYVYVVYAESWLNVSVDLAGSYATVSASASQLAAGTYCALVTVSARNASYATLSSRVVAVQFTVSSSAASSSAAAASSASSASSQSSTGLTPGGEPTVPVSSSSSSFSSTASVQLAPGTASNPLLYAGEAGLLQKSDYLLYGTSGMDPWVPLYSAPDCVSNTCLSVGAGQTYSTIQAAVQAATSLSGTARVYIRVLPGSYAGPVIVPNVSGAPPISIVGTSLNPADVVVTATIGANTTGTQYGANHASMFTSTDHAYSTYSGCASKSGSIGTTCSAVFWTRAANTQIANLTVQNLAAPGATQAVAFESEGDKTYLYNVRLISRQDTVYLKTPSVSTIARAYMQDSYVEGDVDYVFGRATAVFENVTFKSMSDRSSTSYVFAPSTAPGNSYGFHVINSTFITDGGFGGKAQLGRSWDESAGSTYVPGVSPNGQLVIRDSTISGDFAGTAPWAKAATTGRAYSGNAGSGRDLNDNNYNRLWQYNNTGAGAVN